ncbi:Fascin [Schistosoma haematobium]|uniref:Fascin n=1 Tax=Schistosoma haematobium TaxID=6185 RepID=A0A922IKK9_SCHHA|nr:Fascin [Schistosoma haematobium]KAH9581472.1 Fascin [Schistosoma haematobium]CAH8619393.1 unnamed protein product [Schistosoma haematobium]CAH8627427.1 unnamed protein product [Schistosoma haematobium]
MSNNEIYEDFNECLKIGILHIPSGRFLTAEVFNNEINISGTALRRRQVWSLITDRKNADTLFLQNSLGRFLSVNKDGKISTSLKSDCEERFRLEFAPDGTGEWAFKSDAYGFYLTGTDTQVSCFSKSPVWWSFRLATHPQVHIRHQFRSRYLRLLNDGLELRADQPYPWGPESVIWIEQPTMVASQGFGRGPNIPLVGKAAVSRLGRVAFRMPNGKYLKSNGEMCGEMDDSTLFSFEYRPGNPGTFAFRDQTGHYLTTIGPGTTKVKTNTNIGKEELFLIEHAALQVGIVAHNGKFASVKQGIEISANQHELDETAIFQLEYIGGMGFNALEAIASSPASTLSGPDGGVSDSSASNSSLININHSITNGVHSDVYFLTTGFWRLRSRSGKLWKLASSSGVKNTSSDGDQESLFEMLTVNKVNDKQIRQIVFRSNDEQSLTARKLGAVSTSGRLIDETQLPSPDELFNIILTNRTSIVFLSSLTGGFLVRGKQNILDSNGVAYEPFYIRVTKRHTYKFFARNPNSTYSIWAASLDGTLQLEPTHQTPTDDENNKDTEDTINNDLKYEFQLHFLGHSRVLIQSLNSQRGNSISLVKSEVKGDVKLDIPSGGGDITINYIWEI